MKTHIAQLLDFSKIDTILEGFNKTTGFVTAILDLNGNVLSKSGWRQICTNFHRVHRDTCFNCSLSDTVLANKMAEGEKYHFYKCLNGLIDVAVPVIINGEHMANLFSGQFFFEQPDIDFFRKQAVKYGFNEEKYLEYLNEVPVVTEEKVKLAMDFLHQMTQFISEQAFRQKEVYELSRQIQESESRFRKLFEDGAVGMVFASKDFVFLRANRVFCHLSGYTETELHERNFIEITYPEDRSRDRLNVEKMLIREVDVYRTEKRYVKKNGEIFWAQLTVSPIFDQHGDFNYFVGIIVDITERVQAQKALEAERNRLTGIIEGTQTGTWEWNVQTGETVFNERWAEIIGYTLQELSPVSINTWVNNAHPDDLEKSWELINRHFNKELDYYEYESRVKHRNGDWIWILDRGKVISWTDDGKPLLMMGTHQDITKRKKIEIELSNTLMQLQRFASHVQKIREEEKALLAREIHDDLGQLLVALKIDTGVTKSQFRKNLSEADLDEIKLKLANHADMITRAITSARRIMYGLRPVKLEMLGFAGAAMEYIADFSARYAIECISNIDLGIEKLDEERSLAMYRILQETLMNVVKHANATRVEILYHQIESEVIFEVIDNGIGFDLVTDRKDDSYGILGINERVSLLNGLLRIESSPTKGTRIIVKFPLN